MNGLLGIFGGSFNPIHSGHLILAEFIREEFKLDRIIFIPTGNPPHKKVGDLERAQYRYDMVKLAIEDNPFFDISDIELKREGFSYTSDTLKKMKEIYPDEELFFICGGDSIIQFPTWHEIGTIFELASIIVAERPNVLKEKLENMINEFREKYGARILCSSAPHIGISASEIRKRLKQGLSVRYMVPRAVYEYIEKNNLYRGV
ncbi:nicotinate-nucleotide adenylyltransferase [Thermoclostridium stercorarium]|uniref:nicotinate-nucleotide adenylyltransferase n=2 Tax=Thermoclostridium stercorarium TaxID=1510 RepID=UPI0021500862|nr:nicotinate-nucleotide adenylyltransferase [Thermoclostridium stercorarium]UZQ86738.1 nicotinate-nucleotide adenylyltransferase [Thermoclostridium stercorarium]